jgi:hypothetical protein
MVTLIFFFSMGDTLPTGQLSNIPWRRTGVKYTNNEAYFDVIEEIDVIIDRSGSTVFAEIQGYVRLILFVIVFFFLTFINACARINVNVMFAVMVSIVD